MSDQSKEELQEDIDNYTEAIRLNPEDSYAYYYRGNAKGNLGDIQGAIEDYTEAIRLEPDYHANAYFSRGVAKGKSGNYQRAIGDFTEVIRIDPHNTWAYYNRGISALLDLRGLMYNKLQI